MTALRDVEPTEPEQPVVIKRPIRREGARECYYVIAWMAAIFAVLYVCLALQAGTWGV